MGANRACSCANERLCCSTSAPAHPPQH